MPQELLTSGTVNVQRTTPSAFYPNYSLKNGARGSWPLSKKTRQGGVPLTPDYRANRARTLRW